jgi:hypothetical protein
VRILVALAIAGCHGTSPAHDAASTHGLAMSDVSILLPLPADPSVPVLVSIAGDGSGEPLVATGLFGALVLYPGDIAPKTGPQITYDQMQVVAVRIDLCDRATVGPCDESTDGRLRLVLQPMYTLSGATAAQDIAVHVFYAIPNAELAGTIGDLRALAAIQDAAPDSPLAVSTSDASYIASLRTLVLRYARQSNLTRITVIGQVANAGAFEWKLRGFEKNIAYDPIQIAQIADDVQSALIAGGDIVYNIDPLADAPPGFALAVNGVSFDQADRPTQIAALGAIAQVENPLLHDNVDTQCIACHVAEFVGTYRAAALGVSLSAMNGYFATPRNTSVQTIADTDSRVVRAFGWIASQPVITRRVANATAEVLDEIDARFPP